MEVLRRVALHETQQHKAFSSSVPDIFIPSDQDLVSEPGQGPTVFGTENTGYKMTLSQEL